MDVASVESSVDAFMKDFVNVDSVEASVEALK